MRGEFIDLSGERLYYYAAGSRGSGEPILLIHGFPTSSHLWLDVVAKLPPGHRVIVVDLLGFGRSDAPLDADYTVGGHSRRLLHLLDALRIDRACVVGHGTGGAIAISAALSAPDRISRVGLIGDAATEGWFAGHGALVSSLRSWMLHLPRWSWLPLVKSGMARGYSDAEQGARSVELYLMPFAQQNGAKVLRRHFAQLGNGQIAEVTRRAREIKVPMIESPRASRFHPEEAPSDVAATIAKLLSATAYQR